MTTNKEKNSSYPIAKSSCGTTHASDAVFELDLQQECEEKNYFFGLKLEIPRARFRFHSRRSDFFLGIFISC